ncbi:CGNR zinc finger domain-containing protein [Streptomyces zagrosensis]|uniref:Putative RNA-binding Zn ribbon-like protein n=1 Tax=Streptomyces zagrosensis TaxID=1042984 RepID=A0A7W9V027_9ACTN|nr:CGNR zinc finger domain-containing protein [Streptomyces zagrosensis]MBB5936901.1 putative RNA-binding Zn ribbon-like protein [Streptomyces zagrosensis]
MHEEPATARLVEAFVNTVDVDLGTDDLSAPEQLTEWLHTQDLLERPGQAGPSDLELALRLRAGMREKLGISVGDQPDASLVAEAERALRDLPLLATIGGPPPSPPTSPADATAGSDRGGGARVLVPAPGMPAVRQALAAVAVAWSELLITGDAARLKRCAEHSCAWVFWDVSKNRSRRWCSMRVCGNRNKARRFAAKRSTDAATPAPPTA